MERMHKKRAKQRGREPSASTQNNMNTGVQKKNKRNATHKKQINCLRQLHVDHMEDNEHIRITATGEPHNNTLKVSERYKKNLAVLAAKAEIAKGYSYSQVFSVLQKTELGKNLSRQEVRNAQLSMNIDPVEPYRNFDNNDQELIEIENFVKETHESHISVPFSCEYQAMQCHGVVFAIESVFHS
jgi:hypothetical protein